MKISPHTLRTHCERLYRKLDVHNRTALLVRIYREFGAMTRSAGLLDAGGLALKITRRGPPPSASEPSPGKAKRKAHPSFPTVRKRGEEFTARALSPPAPSC
jgi:hypothetical protein